MGNPWAPPDQSQPRDPGAQPGDGAPPTAPGAAWHPGQAGPPAGAQGGPPPGPPAAPHQGPYAGGPYPGGPGGPHPGGPGGPGGPHPPHGGWQQPPGPRPPAPPDPAGVARATRAAVWSACLLLLGVLLMSAPFPGLLLAPVTAVASLTLAIVAVVRAARARARGQVVGLAVVLIAASLLWTVLSSQSLLYVDAVRDLQSCSGAALTQQAQRACQTQFDQAVQDRVGSLVGRRG